LLDSLIKNGVRDLLDSNELLDDLQDGVSNCWAAQKQQIEQRREVAGRGQLHQKVQMILAH